MGFSPAPDDPPGHFQVQYCACILIGGGHFEPDHRKTPRSGPIEKAVVRRRNLCKFLSSEEDRRRCGKWLCQYVWKLPGRKSTSCCPVHCSRRNMAGKASPRRARANGMPARQFYKRHFLPVSNPPFYLKVLPRVELNILNPAGVIKTISSEGKINKPMGRSILIGALWASSSANCRRFIRI